MPIKHEGMTPTQWMNETKKVIRQLPLKIGNLAQNHFAKNFQTESWEGRKWPARSKWAMRNEGRALLRDTGTLFRALSKYVNGFTVRIYIAAPANKYADIHNEGGTIELRPNVNSIKFFWAMHYRAGSGVEKSRWKAMALKMQSGRSIMIKVPQRKFIGESQQLNSKIEAKINSELERLNTL
jgi:phage gpG-like protein